jgi:hypothetical protein
LGSKCFGKALGRPVFVLVSSARVKFLVIGFDFVKILLVIGFDFRNPE